MNTVTTFQPQQIYAARLRAGLSQEDLAHELRGRGFGTTAKSVSHWERGVNRPSADILPSLAAALGVTLDSLYGYVAA